MDTRSPLEMRALRYLAQREYSRLELEQKLSVHARSFPPEALSAVLDKLEQNGFLSTERAVEQIIRTRRSRFGSQRIVYELIFSDNMIGTGLVLMPVNDRYDQEIEIG